MMATVPHVTSGLGLRKFQADGFLLTRVYNSVGTSQYVMTRMLVAGLLVQINCIGFKRKRSHTGVSEDSDPLGCDAVSSS